MTKGGIIAISVGAFIGQTFMYMMLTGVLTLLTEYLTR